VMVFYVQDERYVAVPWMGKSVYVQDERYVAVPWMGNSVYSLHHTSLIGGFMFIFWQRCFLLLITNIMLMCIFIKPAISNQFTFVEEHLNQLVAQKIPPQVYGKLLKQTKQQNKQHRTIHEGEKFYFSGESYQGKPTRIFAIFNTPKNVKAPFPAVVLVHGGGGTAFSQWVKKWNDAGFAALSIAVEGQTDMVNKNSSTRANKWQRHQWAGPARTAIYGDSKQPLRDQWMFHASSAVIRAHNLLRSFKEIDATKIGLSGISWGGVISSTVLGFDQRFAFAVPIYGSGTLSTMDNQYGKALQNNELYKTFWEPNLRIANYQGPILWLTGLKEKHFSLDAQAQTYNTASGTHQVTILEKLKHSHGAGWAPKEPYAFARAVVDKKELPMSFAGQVIDKQSITVSLNKAKQAGKITSATLWLTKDSGHTGQRKWQQLPVTVSENKNQLKLKFMATLPKNTTSWFFNVELDGLTYSSDFFNVRH